MTTASDHPAFQIRQALPGETAIVSDVLQEAARWLVESGTPMWKDGELAADRIAADVEAGLFFIAWAGDQAAGVFKMQPEDPLFWPDLLEGEALYLHRIAVRREFAGQGVMSTMVAFALDATGKAGRQHLRLDCEAARPRLRAAYERLGFRPHSERQVGPYFVARYEQSLKWPTAEEVINEIEAAFSGVTLGNGIGLQEAQGLDDYEDRETLAAYRKRDEKEDWHKLGHGALNSSSSSLSFFDAEGMRFHLPAFMIGDLREEYRCGGLAFHLTRLSDHKADQLSCLSLPQRASIRSFLRFLANHPDYEEERETVLRSLRGFWSDYPTT